MNLHTVHNISSIFIPFFTEFHIQLDVFFQCSLDRNEQIAAFIELTAVTISVLHQLCPNATGWAAFSTVIVQIVSHHQHISVLIWVHVDIRHHDHNTYVAVSCCKPKK
jgi:hypothetical protein